MPVKKGKVEFHAGTAAVGAPDDLEKVIVDFIDNADSEAGNCRAGVRKFSHCRSHYSCQVQEIIG